MNKRTTGNIVWVLWGIAVVGFLLYSFSLGAASGRQITQQKQLNDDLARIQQQINKSSQEKQAKETQIAETRQKLDSVKSAFAGINFPRLVESKEYDALFFDMANRYGLTLNAITASPTVTIRTENLTYRLVSFSLGITCDSPTSLLQTEMQHRAYLTAAQGNLMAFMKNLVVSENFTSTELKSFSINVPPPMTSIQIDSANQQLKTFLVRSLTPDETRGKAVEEIAQLGELKLAQQSPQNISHLLDDIGFNRPTANLIIDILAYERD